MKSLKLLGVLWVIRRLFGPETPPRTKGIQERPLRLPGRSVFVGDTEVFVREAGRSDGPVVVLLHGLGLDSALAWYRVIPLLEDRFRIVSVDLHGSGKTDRGRDVFEIADMADEVAGALQAVGVDRATIVGYSMGGAVAQELAHRHPLLVERLVLVATLAFHPPAWRRVRIVVGILGRGIERISRIEISWVWYRYLLAVGAVDESGARWLWETRMNRDPELLYRSLFAMLRFDSSPWVGRLEIPSTVVIPLRDQLVLPVWQGTLAALSEADVIEAEGARHELPMTHPEVVVSAINGRRRPSHPL
ncbi:MAG: alpha/beta hydrolase [Acidimicrobiia bacterium]